MRRAVVLTAGVAALLAAPSPAQAWWRYHGGLFHHKHQAAPAAPLAFQLPFGFGVNVSGVQVHGPLGNTIGIGDQGRRPEPTPAPRITIDESTKAEIRSVGTDLDKLLEKTNKNSAKYKKVVNGKEEPLFPVIEKGPAHTPGTSLPPGTSPPPGGKKD
jgi:hypothetical protein